MMRDSANVMWCVISDPATLTVFDGLWPTKAIASSMSQRSQLVDFSLCSGIFSSLLLGVPRLLLLTVDGVDRVDHSHLTF
jgi:hypothetical protein